MHCILPPPPPPHAAPRAALTCPTVAAVPVAGRQTDSARHHIPGDPGRAGRMLVNVRKREQTPGATETQMEKE